MVPNWSPCLTVKKQQTDGPEYRCILEKGCFCISELGGWQLHVAFANVTAKSSIQLADKIMTKRNVTLAY